MLLQKEKGNEKSFLDQLEKAHNFPGQYTFKFIVKNHQKNEVVSLVKDAQIEIKKSTHNNYISLSLLVNVRSSHEVLNIYKKAKEITGIIAL